MATFDHVQVGALETQEFRITPAPFWLVCFSDTIKGPMRRPVRQQNDEIPLVPRCEELLKQRVSGERSRSSLPRILDLVILIPHNHRVPRIYYRNLERAVVFTLEQKLCPIFPSPHLPIS